MLLLASCAMDFFDFFTTLYIFDSCCSCATLFPLRGSLDRKASIFSMLAVLMHKFTYTYTQPNSKNLICRRTHTITLLLAKGEAHHTNTRERLGPSHNHSAFSRANITVVSTRRTSFVLEIFSAPNRSCRALMLTAKGMN